MPKDIYKDLFEDAKLSPRMIVEMDERIFGVKPQLLQGRCQRKLVLSTIDGTNRVVFQSGNCDQ